MRLAGLLFGIGIGCGSLDPPPSPRASPPAPSAPLAVDTGGSSTSPSTPTLPTHDACLPEGEEMDDATCAAVVAADGRFPGQSYDRSWATPPAVETRYADPDYVWLEEQIRRCTCVCCHQSSLGGPGAYFWDLDFRGEVGSPVEGQQHWIDSASDWSLEVLIGRHYSENQHLPVEDQGRLEAVVQKELDRRDASP